VFGVNGWEVVLLALIAVFVLGPDRLPEYAAKLAHGIRKLRVMAEGAKDQLKDQLGPEYEEINWRQYDPRQYDPRRIVKEALLDPLDDAIAPVRSEIDSVRSVASRKGDVAGGTVAAGAVGAEAVVADTSLGAPDAQHSFDPSAYPRAVKAYDPARPTPYDPDAT
jgi:sec-independent protein translocase protein TatB